MKNNFEKKQNNFSKPSPKLNRREFIEKLSIGFGIGTIIYLIKNLFTYKKKNKNEKENELQIISNLEKNIEIIKIKVNEYLKNCNDYHKHLKKEFGKIKNEFATNNNVDNYKNYIEKLEEYLMFLTYIDEEIIKLAKKIENAIVIINNLNISQDKIDDAIQNLLELLLEIKKTEKNNLELIEEILKFKITLKKEINSKKHYYTI